MSTPNLEDPDGCGPERGPTPEPELDLVGQVVGEYVVEGRLGSGAFGTVYKGVHPLIGKAVAIKVLSRRFSADPEMVSRFVAEARAVNQIRHRNIIDIFSFGQLEDGRHYYVMEYLEGETLQALLDRERRVSPARCLAILRAIGRALDAAHAKGIAHRDLKAENIFLGTDSDGGAWPKLLDFGIAKLTSSEDGFAHKTRSGVSIGTPLYMSPEQCHGRQVDHRTDIYAFGILIYLMLTGVFPFDGDSYMEILMQQVGSAAAPPSAHVPELPEAIDDVVLWLIHKDPAQRPPDLKTAVIVLEQAAARSGLLGPAAQTSAWELISGASSTQPANVVVPRSPSAPGLGVSAAYRPGPSARPRRSPETGRRAPGSGRAAARDAAGGEAGGGHLIGEDATDGAGASAEVGHSRKLPIIAVASLVAITAIVAAAVALYPGSGDTSQVAPHRNQVQPAAQTQLAGQAQLPGQAPALVRVSSPAQRSAAPAPPAAITLTIEGVPAGTDVVVGGRRLGGAPGRVQLPYSAEPLALALQASGYLPAVRSIVPDRDRSLSLTLARQPPRPGPRGGRRTTRDDIIDVFGGGSP